jgi:hypothetical protein
MWKLVKMALKVGVEKCGCEGKEKWKLLGFVALVHVWVYSAVVLKVAFVKDCRGLGLCIVGTVS